jgi:hypothetical protein
LGAVSAGRKERKETNSDNEERAFAHGVCVVRV